MQFDKVEILCNALIGITLKYLTRWHILRPNRGINTTEARKQPVIISLTSYGRRVSEVVDATIVSLLRQTYRPDMVILWLDKDNWNDNILPSRLVRLQAYGLTIRYCNDLKSYKKIVPALIEYPDAKIVTCDDDLYYKSNMLERLVAASEEHPDCICAHRAHRLTFRDGKLQPYGAWPEEISDEMGTNVFPTSGGGTLYQSSLLYKDITNQTLFQNLSPRADDVWLYFMGRLQGTPNYVLKRQGFLYYQMDVFYQTLHQDASLKAYNYNEGQNDKQIQAIIDYYGFQL